MNHYKDKTVWVIGATDGIGKAITQKLADNGAKHLILSSRSDSKLKALSVSINCANSVYAFDVSNYDETIRQASSIFDKFKGIDSIIYLPAFYEPSLVSNISRENLDKTIDINLKAVFYFIDAVLPYIKSNPKCQLAITASSAGYIGLPNSQPYGATKAAVISLVESLKCENSKLDIRLINPSFVKTKLTDKNDFKMPAIITPELAADAVLKGLAGKKFEIHFNKKFTIILKLISILPYSIYFKIAKKLAK